MKKLIPAGMALALLFAGAAFAGDEKAATDRPFAEAKAEAVPAGKNILVDFYATW